MFKIYGKIAQTEHELEIKADEVSKSDYTRFNDNKLAERIRNLEKKANDIELISQKTLKQVE